jgi:serine/threonine protein kinase
MPSVSRNRQKGNRTIKSPQPIFREDEEKETMMMTTLTHSVENMQLDNDDHDVTIHHLDQGHSQEPLNLLHDFIDFDVDPRQHFQCTRVIANVEGGQVAVARVLAATPVPSPTSSTSSYVPGVLRAPTGALIAVKVIAKNRIEVDWAHDLTTELRIVRGTLLQQQRVTAQDSDATSAAVNGSFHPNIFLMDALYIDREDDLLWITMELLDRNLYRIIAQTVGSTASKGGKGMIKENMIARFVLDVRYDFDFDLRLFNQDANRCTWQLLTGIEYLQKAGIAHRDLRPAVLWFNGAGYLKICKR